ncbi:MFS transporter [Alterisphingorhabdus coralli]|uniref:MFS transporter n=1 Tax=Alterisphingorhabdus coralli TaxID=3071408 RepID=A0AA97F655_9SPHN|nr:MFS transporter [Parasphingorhabdus sp. SCSIO 66989]WOE75104.1 MFS transporter [Parasphingorhabdus sp. SCSIO 66989]
MDAPRKTETPSILAGTTVPRDRMAVLFLVMLVTAAGNTAMQSVMPGIGTKLGIPDFWVSLAYSWSALLWMLTAPYWARMSDKRGRKALMKLGMWGFISSFAICATILWFGLNGYLGPLATIITFAIFRSLYGGFGSAAPPAVQAYVAARTDRALRTRVLAIISSSFGLGTVLGPAIAPLLILPLLGLVSPFLFFAGFGLLVYLALRLRLPDDDPRYAARGQVVNEPSTSSSAAKVSNDGEHAEHSETESTDEEPERLKWTDKRIRPWLVTGLLGGHAQAIILGMIGFLLLDRLGLRATPAEAAGPTGLVLMAGAIATLLSQWGLIPYLQMGPRASTLWGALLGGIGCLMIGLAGELHSITLGYVVASMGFGLFRPGFTAGASLSVTRPEQGQVAGIVASVNGAAFVVGPAFGVWLYNVYAPASFGLLVALTASVLLLGWRGLQADNVLEGRA